MGGGGGGGGGGGCIVFLTKITQFSLATVMFIKPDFKLTVP